MILDREVKILLRKEWRQLTASRSAVLTSLLLPLVSLLIVPVLMMVAVKSAPPKRMPHEATIGMFKEVADDPTKMPIVLLPLMVVMAGLILPTALVTHLVVTERESRTLELLVALPVRLEQLLKAKLAAVLMATLGATVPLVLIDCVVLLATGLGRLTDVVGLPILLLCVLIFSNSGALLVALLAKDFRTANSVAGFVIVPALLFGMAGSMLLPAGWIRPVGLGAVYAIAGVFLARVALRVVTFERLMR